MSIDFQSRSALSVAVALSGRYGVANANTSKPAQGGSVAEQAKVALYEISHLAIGKVAPDIEGKDQDELKKVMTKEKLNWRSFADQGDISRQWNSPATPAFYIIDHKGTIRRKWVGSPGKKAIDDALEDLIQEAEAMTVLN